MRQWKPVLFILAVSLLFFLPDPESLIIKIVSRAGLVMIVVRGLTGYYEDFCQTLTRGKGRR